MPYHDGFYSTPWMWLMMAFMMVFWIVLIVGIIWLVVYLARNASRGSGTGNTNTALDILNQRYARGEIGKDEYERLKADITR